MTNIHVTYVCGLVYHWLRQWLVTCSVPSHYLTTAFLLLDLRNFSYILLHFSLRFDKNQCIWNAFDRAVLKCKATVEAPIKQDTLRQSTYKDTTLPALGTVYTTHVFRTSLDSFTVSLHSPNGRQMPAVRSVQGDCQWPLKWVEILTDHTSAKTFASDAIQTYIQSSKWQTVMSANWRPCLIRHWLS